MAFSLTANNVSLTNGSPFYLGGLAEWGAPPVTRLYRPSPDQQGVTDTGYRVQPRVFSLEVLFYATTDAMLDSYRDTLMDIFVPTELVELAATRDDAKVRYLNCYALDVDIQLVPEERAAHLHRATITLRAAGAFWQGAPQGTVTAATSVSIVNQGNMPLRPDFVLTGPITNPTLTNTNTGGSINLTGLVLGAGQAAFIRLSDGYKRVESSAGSTLLGSVTVAPLGLAEFACEPSSPGFGGTTSITRGGSGTTAATQISATWTSLYTGY